MLSLYVLFQGTFGAESLTAPRATCPLLNLRNIGLAEVELAANETLNLLVDRLNMDRQIPASCESAIATGLRAGKGRVTSRWRFVGEFDMSFKSPLCGKLFVARFADRGMDFGDVSLESGISRKSNRFTRWRHDTFIEIYALSWRANVAEVLIPRMDTGNMEVKGSFPRVCHSAR